MTHTSVLLKEVLENLDPKPGENFMDCTTGLGGHSFAILEKTAPLGKILGVERDESLATNLSLEIKKRGLEERFLVENDSFANLKKIIERRGFSEIKGILADLGVCSWHFEESGRGFSFLKEQEHLDMRFDIKNNQGGNYLTAKIIINSWRKEEIEKILEEYGEEKFARKIAEKIFEARKKKRIETVGELVEILRHCIPTRFQNGRTNFATKTFQALRIAVNDELENLKIFLSQAIDVLPKNGRIAVISFHSLEDRIVKIFFREQNKNNLIKILTKKPIIAGFEEIKNNPRSRSAKLRVAEKL